MDQYYQGYEGQEEIQCDCSPDATCQQYQDDQYDLNCECSPSAACQQQQELTCACSKNAMCKKSPEEKQLLELTDIGLLKPEIENIDLDPLLEEPYSNVDLTNSQVIMADAAGEGEMIEGANDTIVFDPDDLFLFVAPQSHNLAVQRQRLLDSYIEDLSISEVEEAAVALRLLVNLFRQRRMDMNKLVPLFSLGGKGQGDLLGCGCPR